MATAARGMDVILENVRCFRGRHEIPVRPLTLLVGENSSGKTTFLAMMQAMARLDFGDVRFDRDPYELGGYESIVSAPKNGDWTSTFFGLGVRFDKATPGDYERYARFGLSKSVIALESIRGATADAHAELNLREKNAGLHVVQRLGVPPMDLEVKINGQSNLFGEVSDAVLKALFKRLRDDGFAEAMNLALNLVFARIAFEVRSLAPVRTKPKRNYEPHHQLISAMDSDGYWLPAILRASIEQSDEPGASLTAALSAYGRESGLFDAVAIRRLGDQPRDPFQLRNQHGWYPGEFRRRRLRGEPVAAHHRRRGVDRTSAVAPRPAT